MTPSVSMERLKEIEAATSPMPEEVRGLVDRLRGIYRIPITDGMGAVGAGEEPNNPSEFVRKFEASPINREAAALIEQLSADKDAAFNAGYASRDGVVEACRKRAEAAISALSTAEARALERAAAWHDVEQENCFGRLRTLKRKSRSAATPADALPLLADEAAGVASKADFHRRSAARIRALSTNEAGK